jgi:hypothetical protein
MDKKLQHEAPVRFALASVLLTALCSAPAVADMPDEPPAGPAVDIVGYWKTDSLYFQLHHRGSPACTVRRIEHIFRGWQRDRELLWIQSANRSISHGRWQQTDKRTFIVRSEMELFQGPPPAPPAAPAVNTYSGYQVIERQLELAADGNSLTSTARVTRLDIAGVVTLSFCMTETGLRQPEPAPQ